MVNALSSKLYVLLPFKNKMEVGRNEASIRSVDIFITLWFKWSNFLCLLQFIILRLITKRYFTSSLKKKSLRFMWLYESNSSFYEVMERSLGFMPYCLHVLIVYATEPPTQNHQCMSKNVTLLSFSVHLRISSNRWHAFPTFTFSTTFRVQSTNLGLNLDISNSISLASVSRKYSINPSAVSGATRDLNQTNKNTSTKKSQTQ